MNRHLRGLAVAALATGVTLAVPGLAGADPVITAPPGSIQVGRTDVLTGTDCIDATDGQAYVGQFVAFSSDPDNLFQTLETPAEADGSWSWELTPRGDTPLTGFEITFYCARVPITSLSSPDVLWASAPYTKTVVAGQNAAGARLAAGTESPIKAAKGGPMTRSFNAPMFTVDPDSLPRVDRVNIQGKAAAALKMKAARADAKFRPFVKAYNKVLRKLRVRQISSEESYVTAAYIALSGKTPTSRQLAKGVAALRTGQPKVQVVEDIAIPLGYK